MVIAHQNPGLIGRKIGMMTVFDASGRARGVTVIEVTGNRITQIRTQDRDGYEAVQVGAPGKRNRINKPEQGHLRKSETESLSELREFRILGSDSFELGEEIGADQFESGTYVNVTGVTKGLMANQIVIELQGQLEQVQHLVAYGKARKWLDIWAIGAVRR